MTFFTDADVAEFADMVQDASPDTAIISRQVGTSPDGHGGTIDEWDEVATVNVKVGMMEATPTEQTIASQNVGLILMAITMPAGTDVHTDDTIQVVRDDADDLYEVVGLVPVRSFDVRRRVVVRMAS